MSDKKTPKTPASAESSKLCLSTFTLTFVVEVLGIDIFHDCNEGAIDLGPGPVQGMKLQYQLVPGHNYDVDILIWPHTAKIWCGMNSGWVRTWYFLQRRWLAFSIRHALPVRVLEYRCHYATVNPIMGLGTLSANAKNDKCAEVYLPKLSFGERRQFASVQELEESLINFIIDLIWSLVSKFIPASNLDGPFDTPYPVTDKRHQDAVLEHVQELILNKEQSEFGESVLVLESTTNPALKSKDPKDKKKVAEVIKFEIKLSGDSIISGTGRIIPFEVVGDKPSELGDMIVLVASANLPAQDDHPVIFVNIGTLTDVPLEEFKKHKISHIYTKWIMGEEEHVSELQQLKTKNEIDFNDHHAVPLEHNASEVMAGFLDHVYKIELRGIRPVPSINDKPKFFGYAKGDRDFGSAVPPKLPNLDTDIIIATTKIDARELSNAVNSLIRGEYALYPPDISVAPLEREGICSNDINAVRKPLIPNLVVPASTILEAQMTLEVSIGLVGCKPQRMPKRYSRLYFLVNDTEGIMAILRHITEINEDVVLTGIRDNLLTGFALDTGDTVILYVEGPRDGQILRVFEITEDFYPKIKPYFSTSAKFPNRLYPELLMTTMPFTILKMFVPLSVVLACPPVYARPALPLPTRFAVMKIGRLLAADESIVPTSNNMPTMAEMKSFRLELCVAPRPPAVTIGDVPIKLSVHPEPVNETRASEQSVQRINWESNKTKSQKELKKVE
ncbi:uncharacterized protein LOC142976289 [Anticarsia gemmatalis]|uniref:uncharacterized protein LOC142976289 n=1 Tax=Anticarsia gemmatalis TaxID=129554 RepID=UPI003F76A0F5